MNDYFYSLQMAIIRSPFWDTHDIRQCAAAVPVLYELQDEENR